MPRRNGKERKERGKERKEGGERKKKPGEIIEGKLRSIALFECRRVNKKMRSGEILVALPW